MNNSLLSLYQYILASFCSRWLCDEDLCYLDTAICSHQFREHFLSSVEKCTIFHTNADRSNLEESYEWMCLRGLRLKKIRVRQSADKSIDIILKLATTTCRISYLEFPACPQYVSAFSSLGLVIESLKIYGSTFDSVVKGFLRTCGQGVLDLDISDCSGLSGSICSKITKYCPSIKSIAAPFGCSGLSMFESGLEKYTGNMNAAVKSKKDYSTYYCELTKTYDTSAMEISGNYYQLKKITVYSNFTQKEADSLTPFLSSLESCRIDDSSVALNCVAKHCTNLVSLRLSFSDFMNKEVRFLIERSPLLVKVEIHSSRVNKSVDKLMHILCRCCPQLQIFDTLVTASEDLVGEMFSRCSSLRRVSFLPWVLTRTILCCLASGLNCLDVKHSNTTSYVEYANVRGQEQLSYASSSWIDIDAWRSIVSNNPNLTSLSISGPSSLNTEVIKHLVSDYPLLSSISITHCSEIPSDCLSYLAQCKNLTSLSLRDLRKVTIP